MIISRTPFRISFFGGGTDYPAWYLQNGGQVLSTTIDKYCYLTLRYLPPFFEHKYRIVYSKMESVKKVEEIVHPIVRETLRCLKFKKGLEIHHDGDLPARSGMGSSSSFAVGLLNAINALQGRMSSKMDLATQAMHIERDLVGDTVGSQDQTAAAFGGLNRIVFHRSGQIEVQPITIHSDRLLELNENLMLFYTGIMRTASGVAKNYVEDIDQKEQHINRMHEMVDEGVQILTGNNCLCSFGDLLHQAWLSKKSISKDISNPVVDDIYERARRAGALGGKLTGAGGGGFFLMYVPKTAQSSVREALKELLLIPFRFDINGSQIIFYDPKVDDFDHIEDERDHMEFNCFRELHSLKGKAAACIEKH